MIMNLYHTNERLQGCGHFDARDKTLFHRDSKS